MTAFFLFHHASNKYLLKTYFVLDALCGTGDPKIKEGSRSTCTARVHWWYFLALFMNVFAPFCMQLV